MQMDADILKENKKASVLLENSRFVFGNIKAMREAWFRKPIAQPPEVSCIGDNRNTMEYNPETSISASEVTDVAFRPMTTLKQEPQNKDEDFLEIFIMKQEDMKTDNQEEIDVIIVKSDAVNAPPSPEIEDEAPASNVVFIGESSASTVAVLPTEIEVNSTVVIEKVAAMSYAATPIITNKDSVTATVDEDKIKPVIRSKKPNRTEEAAGTDNILLSVGTEEVISNVESDKYIPIVAAEKSAPKISSKDDSPLEDIFSAVSICIPVSPTENHDFCTSPIARTEEDMLTSNIGDLSPIGESENFNKSMSEVTTSTTLTVGNSLPILEVDAYSSAPVDNGKTSSPIKDNVTQPETDEATRNVPEENSGDHDKLSTSSSQNPLVCDSIPVPHPAEVSISDLTAIKTWPIFHQPESLTDLYVDFFDSPDPVNAPQSPEIKDEAPASPEINNVVFADESSASTVAVLPTATEVASTVVIEKVAAMSYAAPIITNEDSITATVDEYKVKPVIKSKKPNRTEEAAGTDDILSSVGTEDVISNVESEMSIPVVAAEESAPRITSKDDSPLEDIFSVVSGCIPVNVAKSDSFSTLPTAGTEEPILTGDIVDPSPMEESENFNKSISEVTTSTTLTVENSLPILEVNAYSSAPVDNGETSSLIKDNVAQAEIDEATKNVLEENSDDHDKPSTSSFQNHLMCDSIPLPHPVEVSVSDLIAIKTWPIFHQPKSLRRSLTDLQVEFFEDLQRQTFFLCPEQWFLSQRFLPFSGACESCGCTDFLTKRCKSYGSLCGSVCANMQSPCPITLFQLPKLLQDDNLISVLKIIFHWTAQSDVKVILKSANVTATCVWDIYTKIREICSAELSNKCFVLGANRIVKSTIVHCETYFMMLCEDAQTCLTRMKLYKIEELKSCYIIQDLKSWCEDICMIIGYFPPSVKKHLGSDFKLLSSIVTECKAIFVEKLTKLATTVITTLFDKNFNSQVDLKTMQALLDEVVWRQIYNVSSSYTFFSIFKQIIYYDQKSRRALGESMFDDSDVTDDESSTLTLSNFTDDHHMKDETFKRVTFCDTVDDKKETNKTTYLSTSSLPVHTYKCFICTMKIDGKMAFMDHVQNHATSNKDIIIEEMHSHVCRISYSHCLYSSGCSFIKKQLEKNPKECSLCKLSFQYKDDLDGHVKKTHDVSLQPYVCKICNLGFLQYEAMMAHFHTDHVNTGNLLCPYCLEHFPMELVAQKFYSTEIYCKHLLNHENPLENEDCLSCSL